MKSLKKRTPAKKQKQQASNMSDQDNTVVLDTANATDTSYILNDTVVSSITLDPSIWNSTVTLPNSYTISSGTSSTLSWNDTYSSYNSYTTNITADGITMKEGADIKIGSKSLTEAIEKIEERLGILRPNPELEGRWEQLKDLRRQYQELEKELLEKEKMWKILKQK